jgi:hypothetical protein
MRWGIEENNECGDRWNSCAVFEKLMEGFGGEVVMISMKRRLIMVLGKVGKRLRASDG